MLFDKHAYERDRIRDELQATFSGRLVEIIGDESVRMRYAAGVVVKYGLKIVGWPQSAQFRCMSSIRGGVGSLRELRRWHLAEGYEKRLRFARATREDIASAARDPDSVHPSPKQRDRERAAAATEAERATTAAAGPAGTAGTVAGSSGIVRAVHKGRSSCLWHVPFKDEFFQVMHTTHILLVISAVCRRITLGPPTSPQTLDSQMHPFNMGQQFVLPIDTGGSKLWLYARDFLKLRAWGDTPTRWPQSDIEHLKPTTTLDPVRTHYYEGDRISGSTYDDGGEVYTRLFHDFKLTTNFPTWNWTNGRNDNRFKIILPCNLAYAANSKIVGQKYDGNMGLSVPQVSTLFNEHVSDGQSIKWHNIISDRVVHSNREFYLRLISPIAAVECPNAKDMQDAHWYISLRGMSLQQYDVDAKGRRKDKGRPITLSSLDNIVANHTMAASYADRPWEANETDRRVGNGAGLTVLLDSASVYSHLPDSVVEEIAVNWLQNRPSLESELELGDIRPYYAEGSREFRNLKNYDLIFTFYDPGTRSTHNLRCPSEPFLSSIWPATNRNAPTRDAKESLLRGIKPESGVCILGMNFHWAAIVHYVGPKLDPQTAIPQFPYVRFAPPRVIVRNPLTRNWTTLTEKDLIWLPTKINAVGINRTGDFDVIENIELPILANAPRNILIHYGGVNFIDMFYRKGLYPIASFPQPLGTEAAGEIVALPSGGTVLADEEFKLRGFTVGGKVAVYGLGTLAEYVSVPWTRAYTVPEGVSTRTAAASLTQGATALTFVTEAYNARGATVIGTTSTPEKAALARAAGADHVILYTQEDTVQRVLELTGGEGVHAIFDGVGKDTFESDFKMIRRKGTIVSVGNASGAVLPFLPLKLVEKNVRLLRPTLANYVYTPEEGRRYSTELYKLLASGELNQAQKDLTGGKTVGKLIVKVAADV
ncbi:hypothetical protein C2E23DRAFT_885659 [Lenzites betulinus]|nr:hypothetical protein C2E23DRAFT_885659 [Lenzites betulinus]